MSRGPEQKGSPRGPTRLPKRTLATLRKEMNALVEEERLRKAALSAILAAHSAITELLAFRGERMPGDRIKTPCPDSRGRTCGPNCGRKGCGGKMVSQWCEEHTRLFTLKPIVAGTSVRTYFLARFADELHAADIAEIVGTENVGSRLPLGDSTVRDPVTNAGRQARKRAKTHLQENKREDLIAALSSRIPATSELFRKHHERAAPTGFLAEILAARKE